MNAVLQKPFLKLIVLFSFLLLAGCNTSSAPNYQNMLISLSSSYPAIWKLTTAFAYVLGFYFIMKAVMALKQYGESRTMMSSSHSLKTPMAYILAGSALIFSPTVYKDILLTTFGTTQTTCIMCYENVSGWSTQASDALFGLVQVVGVMAFVRGWIYLAKAGEQGGQPNSFGKGLTHIIGGVLCINIIGTYQVLSNTFGL